MRWFLLVHQLPPRPPYLRAKIGQRLARVGALALKNSVYILPFKADCLEDFEWIGTEAEAGGGEAFVFEARFVHSRVSVSLVRRFRAARQASYRMLVADLRRLERRRRGGAGKDFAPDLARLGRRFEEVARIDFFDAPGRREVETFMAKLEKRVRAASGDEAPRGDRVPKDLRGRTWVTRRGIKIDRIATAWLVRRFVDPRARFRFVDPPAVKRRSGDLLFDMVGGDFTHEGDRCTFETLVSRANIRDRSVSRIAEIVHDIDIKDGKYGRLETSGVRSVIEGLLASHPKDADRLDRGTALFDDLYASFRSQSLPASKS